MDSLCRLCLASDANGVNLFEGVHSKKYSNQLNEMFQIRFQNIPKWPLTACRCCVKKLDDIKDFKANIYASGDKLFQLHSEVRIECETIEVIEVDATNIPIQHGVSGQVALEGDIIEEEGSSEEIPLDDIYFEDFLEDGTLNEEVIALEAVFIVKEELSEDGKVKEPGTDSTTMNRDKRACLATVPLNACPGTSHGLLELGSTVREPMAAQRDERPEKPMGGPLAPVEEKLEQMLRDMNLLKCELCNVELKSLDYLHKHHITAHQIRMSHITCCDVKFLNPSEAYEHMRYHLDKDAFKCEECEESWMSLRRLKKHKVVHKAGRNEDKYVVQFEQMLRDMNLLKCEPCNVVFKSSAGLNNHQRKVHNRWGSINCCDAQFRLRPEAYDHMKYHLDKDAFKCDECEKCLLSGIRLRQHKEICHPPESARFVCPTCGTLHKSKEYLNAHVKTHIPYEERQFKCPKCPRRYNSQSRVNMHLRSHHSDHLACCNVCGKIMREASLRNHVQINHSAEEWPCPTCEKVFMREADLKRHVNERHLGIVYNCEYCRYITNFKNSLSHHRIKHHPVEYAAYHKVCNNRGKV